jgi:F5/8 type C domain
VRREIVLVLAVFSASALVLTFPLALHPARTLPSDLGDTLLTTWIVSWDADRLRHGLRGLWDAPIFYPYRGTLAFSETLLGVAVFTAPVYWVTGDPVLTYNIAFLLSFTIAGIGMYLLARELTGSRAAALTAGLYYAFGPLRMSQISHIQMVATGWIPFALWGLHRYFSTRQRRWLVVFATSWVLQTLSNTYAGYFVAVPIAIVVLDGVLQARERRGRLLAHLCAAGLLAGIALAPAGLAYYHARTINHQVRGVEEIVANSADLRAFIVGKNSVGIWRWLPTAVGIDPEKELFPGLFALCLAAIGVSAAVRDRARRRTGFVYLAIAIVAVALSLGPHVRIWGATITEHGPYSWLLAFVPGMDGMRVPARFAIVAIAAISVLLAIGVDWTLTRAAPRFRRLIAAACLIMVVADGWAVPITTVRYAARGRPEDRAVASWLADRAPGALLHLPARPPTGEQMLDYQFMTLVHGHPIVNGYSGYATPLLDFLASGTSPLNDLARFPSTVRMLRAIGVRYVFVHPGDYDPASRADALPERTIEAFRASGQIAKEAGLPQVTAFELQPWSAPPDASASIVPLESRELSASASESAGRIENLFDGDRDTRWIAGLGGQDGSSWVRVQLAHPADIGRVSLQIAERSMTDYPRRLRIESEDAAGRSRVLYDDAPYTELGKAVVANGQYPDLVIALPHNETAALTIRQTAPSRASWSIHELRLWRYDSTGGHR